jgi:AcrR family transcriptional regulator
MVQCSGQTTGDISLTHPTPAGAAGIPAPPWSRPRAARERARAPLSRDAIVEAALRVLDRDGYDGLSMRRVAEELGTGVASLYWHLANKEELLQLVLDRVIGEVDIPAPEPERWQEQLKEIAREWRRVYANHRDVARISQGRIPVGPNALMATEALLAILRSARLPDQVSAHAVDLLALYMDAVAVEHGAGLPSPAGEDVPPHEVVAMIRDYFASLPPERFPNLVALAEPLTTGGSDVRFEFGLDLIIRGLAAFVPT